MEFLTSKGALCLAMIVAALLGAAGSGAATAPQPNLGEYKKVLVAYITSGQYEHELEDRDAEAQAYIDNHPSGPKLAVVLDIDETSLSNIGQIRADDFGYFTYGPCLYLPAGPCGAIEWDALRLATAIKPTLAVFDDAMARHLTVFFVTGRHEFERQATSDTLRKAGYNDWKDEQLLMEPDDLHVPSAAIFKSKQREDIESRGYTIVANIGDQDSDLDGPSGQKCYRAERCFKLPNPFYYVP